MTIKWNRALLPLFAVFILSAQDDIKRVSAAEASVFLICNAFMFVTAGAVLMLTNHGVIRLNGAAVYVPVSLLLAVVCIDWLLHVSNLQIRTGGAVAPNRSPAPG